MSFPDSAIRHFDAMLRTLSGVDQSHRDNPATSLDDDQLTEQQRLEAGRLMRVNHCGEICAQALYLGQEITAKDQQTKASMRNAAAEESDHLAWCKERLDELDTQPSVLNPLFFAMSFAGGAAAGVMGNRFNLGLVAATEEQVVDHLDSHLNQLPEEDFRSRAILNQMREDEDSHRTSALKHGGSDFPKPVKKMMTRLSRVMTRSTYWI